MALKLYNSLTKQVETFEAIKNGEVSMYVCGITPDNQTHLGHAFTFLTFDVLVRYLKFLGNNVKYVQNVTDIDDDILVRSKKAGRQWDEFGKSWTEIFLKNMKALNWIMPDPYVKATETIPTIIKFVEGLVEKGFAYDAGGTVYFESRKFADYGKLSRLSREEMISISRERGADPDDPAKHDPLDFILWQAKKEGEPSWDSPWGKGRPGWHIECSSMIYQNLDSQIDIHGGGEDLIFPHHESEIAQSESYTGLSPFSKYFMHVTYVMYEGEKMSKSLGNLIIVEDLLKKYSANAIRFLLLSHHYRSRWEYIEEEMAVAAETMTTLETVIARNESDEAISQEFIDALNNDLDTPKALEFLVREKPKSLKSSLRLLGFSL